MSIAKGDAAKRIKLAVIRYQKGHHRSERDKQDLLKAMKRSCDDATSKKLLTQEECDEIVMKTVDAWPT